MKSGWIQWNKMASVEFNFIWIELNLIEKPVAKNKFNFFQLCFKDIGGVGASSEGIPTTRVVRHPQLESPHMWLAEVKEAKASCQTQGGRHVNKGPLPVDRHSRDILGKTPVCWAESEEANDGEDEQGGKPENCFWNIFPTSQGLVEREEGEGCTQEEDQDHVAKQSLPISRTKGGWNISRTPSTDGCSTVVL